ncbi:site-specific DNA-methyltransferase [Nocardioides alkalitolerans]|uniref:site-specific DNA-methyltransferase n=1 Tax=Nocardioides alkalitolerans TaxID=281714 RepID=UPI0004280A26|nr:site-specific DNA-methyltransferase [Nocardioides alkalitolerans]
MTDDVEGPHATPDLRAELRDELVRRITDLAPEVVADGRIDLSRLHDLLGEAADEPGAPERFGLTWPGRRRAVRAAQEPTTATLREVPEHSKDAATTQHAYVEGDNLEVLKLLRTAYLGAVKMIYVDPPYNTGRDFVYADDFTDPLTSYLGQTGQADADGRRLRTNPEADGRFHSRWLSMMHPRLRLARDLLADDGVLLVSIDDHEQAHLRQLCDEIFGEAGFVAAIAHKARGSVSNDRVISASHHTVLVYAKDYERLLAGRHTIGLEPDLTGFDAADERGPYRLVPVDGPGGARKGNPHYEFLGVTGHFRYSRERMAELHAAGEVVRRGGTLLRKYYLDQARARRRTDTTWWDDAGYTSTATSALAALMGGAYFESPKPVSLVGRMLRQFAPPDGSLVLDFFSGSGTTAHAVMQLNAEDGGTRRHVQVQLPAPTPPDSEARAAGFATLTEVGRRRIDLAGEQLRAETTGGRALDVGYRTFELVPGPAPAPGAGEDAVRRELEALRSGAAAVPGQPDDLLTTALLRWGYPLTVRAEPVDLAGISWSSVDEGRLLAYVGPAAPSLAQLEAAVAAGPERLLVAEAVLVDDTVRTSLVQLCRARGVVLRTA